MARALLRLLGLQFPCSWWLGHTGPFSYIAGGEEWWYCLACRDWVYGNTDHYESNRGNAAAEYDRYGRLARLEGEKHD